MATYNDYMAALPQVTYRGRNSEFQREAVARTLDGTNIPPRDIGALSAIHTGIQAQPGTGGHYDHNDGSMHIPINPDEAWRTGASRIEQGRLLAHETGHRLYHVANPVQFMQYLSHPAGRGILEADAENYADQTVPGSRAGYDGMVMNGAQSFREGSYTDRRGQRFGNLSSGLR